MAHMANGKTFFHSLYVCVCGLWDLLVLPIHIRIYCSLPGNSVFSSLFRFSIKLHGPIMYSTHTHAHLLTLTHAHTRTGTHTPVTNTYNERLPQLQLLLMLFFSFLGLNFLFRIKYSNLLLLLLVILRFVCYSYLNSYWHATSPACVPPNESLNWNWAALWQG